MLKAARDPADVVTRLLHASASLVLLLALPAAGCLDPQSVTLRWSTSR